MFLLLVAMAAAQVKDMGYLNISTTTELQLEEGFANECHMWKLETNFRKTELLFRSLSPEDLEIHQKVVYSDTLFDSCPTDCLSENRFCKQFDGNTFDEM